MTHDEQEINAPNVRTNRLKPEGLRDKTGPEGL